MKRFGILALAAAAWGVWADPARALEVDPNVVPEINLGGRAIVTGQYTDTTEAPSGADQKSEIDPSDSSLLFQFSKFLFNDVDYGFGVVGIRLPEDDSQIRDDIFVHQLQVGIGGRNSELMLGRSRLPANALVQFPTVRAEDLLDFTHVGNGASNRNAEEDVIFGEQIRGQVYFPDVRVSALAALTGRAQTDVTQLSDTTRQSGIKVNGLNLALAYDVPEAIKFDRGFRFAGIGLDVQRLDEFSGTGKDEMPAFLAGATYNLSDSPERQWTLDAQGIYNFGVSAPDLDSIVARARAESVAAVAALRYVDRPYLQTRWQAAVTVAFKDYRDFADASAFAVAPSLVYRLGSGIDLLGEYRFLDNRRALAAGTGVDSSHTVFIGLSFAFDATFNERVGQRRSVLNLEHDMLDTGPIFSGE